MTRALVWGLAGLGVFVSGLAFAILAVGLLEGWRGMPDRLSEFVAVLIVATATWTAGVLCERARGRWVAFAVAVVPVAVLVLGFILMERTEGHGAGLAPGLVAAGVALSAALVGGAAYVARRSAPEHPDAQTSGGRTRGAASTLTGIAAAFGLSASGILVGALLAFSLQTFDVIPEGSGPIAWLLLAAVGTAAAGATMVEVAGRSVTLSIAVAGILVLIGLWEIVRSVETTGAEGFELPVIVGSALTFAGLLGLGAWLRRRSLSVSQSP